MTILHHIFVSGGAKHSISGSHHTRWSQKQMKGDPRENVVDRIWLANCHASDNVPAKMNIMGPTASQIRRGV